MVCQVVTEEPSEKRDVCAGGRHEFYQLLSRSRGLSGLHENKVNICEVFYEKAVKSAEKHRDWTEEQDDSVYGQSIHYEQPLPEVQAEKNAEYHNK